MTDMRAISREGIGITSPLLADGLANYTPGISERRSGMTKFLHGGLKNKTAQSNTSQVVSATKQFDAFGNQLSSSGSWSGRLAQSRVRDMKLSNTTFNPWDGWHGQGCVTWNFQTQPSTLAREPTL